MKCTIGAVERMAAAGTKKLAKQLSAGKVIEYYSTNVPERLAEMEELVSVTFVFFYSLIIPISFFFQANIDKMNNDALSKFSNLDPSWRPNLGQVIAEYHLSLHQSIGINNLSI